MEKQEQSFVPALFFAAVHGADGYLLIVGNVDVLYTQQKATPLWSRLLL